MLKQNRHYIENCIRKVDVYKRQDHDLEYMFLDGFLTVANLMGADISSAIAKIAVLSENYGANFLISVSMDAKDIPESCKQYVAVAL